MNTKKLWAGFILVLFISFSVLIFFGVEIYREAPPVPKRVTTPDGTVLFTGADIKDGQNVWQSIGGQELGTVWGHGAYVAPDWTADWLHREAVYMLDYWSEQEYGKPYKMQTDEMKAFYKAKLQDEIRANTYDPATGDLRISELRALAVNYIKEEYKGLFMNGEEQAKLRDAYSIPANTIKDEKRMDKMSDFFFWASWATITDRPGKNITYTNNWPPDDLVGNRPTSSLILWTGFSVILLLLGIGIMAWYYAAHRNEELPKDIPEVNPLSGKGMTPSMKATLKYFWIVSILILVQILMGVITAHYGVEGTGFYGIPLAKILPYSLSRTWHIQLAIFWIATSWLATGLFFAPLRC